MFFADLLHTITAVLPGRKWSFLQLEIVLRDAVTEPTNAHVDVQIQTEVSARSMQRLSKCSVDTQTKVTGAETKCQGVVPEEVIVGKENSSNVRVVC